MVNLRLLATAACLRSVLVVAAKTSALRRSIDPTDAVIAEYAVLHKTLKEDYINEGCVEKWGEFPSAETTTTTTLELPMGSQELHNVKGGMICNCGMLHDLALSAVLQESETKEKRNDLVPGAAIEYSTEQERLMTQLDSWVMARTANGKSKCLKGKAGGYPCKNVDLIAHVPLSSLRTSNSKSSPKVANDVWGWTNNDNSREFVIWGVREGTFFFEHTTKKSSSNDPLVLLGFLPATSGYALQHDMKVIGNYAYIGSEAAAHGMQIFDMRRLLKVQPSKDCVNDGYCQELSPDRLYTGNPIFPISNSHNIIVNEETKYVYIVGNQNSCKGGLHVVDVRDPLDPVNAGCFKGGNYVHDAQCVVYKGPDKKYNNKEICFCYNEDSVKIVDVSNKKDMKLISSTSYSEVEYTHQGWLSSDQSYIVFGDEGDEYYEKVPKTRTLVLNVEDLENPDRNNVREYEGSSAAVDHNQYIIKANAKGQDYDNGADLIYQANYEAGLRILQVVDYETANFKEVGYFDTYPLANQAKFLGAWSSFPFFRSGVVVISSLEEGLFLVQPNLKSSLVGSGEEKLPTGPNGACSDQNLKYQNKTRKNCNWVGKKIKGKPKTSKLRARRRCKTKWLNKTIASWCLETCGRVGLGTCAEKFADVEDAATSETILM